MTKSKKIIVLIAGLLVGAILITGLGFSLIKGNTANKTAGTFTLRVNPEIEVNYNAKGEITELEGKNDEGKLIVSQYNDYIGKNSADALEALITKINENGYFVPDKDGNEKNVYLAFEPGSVLPSDDFINVLTKRVETVIGTLGLSGALVNIAPEDYITSEDGLSKYISEAKAKEVALAHAGLSATDVSFEKAELDWADGFSKWEIDFLHGKTEYDYDINAESGKIIKLEMNTKKDVPATSPDSDNADSANANDGFLSKDDALNIALKHCGFSKTDVSVQKIELDWDDGTPEYEIEFTCVGGNQHEFEIHGKTGNIIHHEKGSDDGYNCGHNQGNNNQGNHNQGNNHNNNNHNQGNNNHGNNQGNNQNQGNQISKNRAIEIALSNASLKRADVQIRMARYNWNDGNPKYEIEFSHNAREYDYDIDAKTGAIID